MRRTSWMAVAIVALLICGMAPTEAGKKKKQKREEPRRVTVQHILVSFKGSNSQKKVTRSKKRADQLAYELMERAEKGEDFDALVKEYTDDSHPGIYVMRNRGFGSPPGGVNRDGMVAEFGDIAFELEVGAMGIARYSVGGSPYGFHVIKRLE